MRALLFSTKGFRVIMYASLAYEGLLAKFWSIFAICDRVSDDADQGWGTHEGQGPPGMLCRNGVDQHVGLGGDYGRVDETQEEKAAYEGTDGVIGGFWILALARHDGQEKETCVEEKAHAGQTSDLFAYPPNAIGDGIHALDDRDEEAVGDLHQHGQTGCDDGLDIRVL